MPAKHPSEMSSWERRKLYSKNLNPSNSVTTASKKNVEQVKGVAKKLQVNVPAKNVLPMIEENPKAKMTTATSSSKPTSKGKTTLAVLPSKALPVVPARRATIAATSRLSLAADRRLTIAATKPAPKRTTMGAEIPAQNTDPLEANTSRKRYYDVASRIFTGIKKSRLDNVRMASSAPSKVFTKPLIAVKSTRGNSNARRSLYSSAKLSTAPADLKKGPVAPLPDQSRPNRESNIMKRKADPLKPKDVKKSRPMAEKSVAAKASSTSKASTSQSNAGIGSKPLSTKIKPAQPITDKKDAGPKKAVVDTTPVISVSTNKVRTVSGSPIATVLPDDNLGNTPRPVRKGTPHRVRCNSYTITTDDDFPKSGGASTVLLDNAGHTPVPSRRGSFTISSDNEKKEETKVAYVSPLKKHSGTLKIERKSLGRTNKTPAKSALKKSVRLSRTLLDSENLPPLETLDGSIVGATPIPKRSKSVSFKVASASKNSPRTLPKTPRRDLSLRQKLELFMEEKGYSVSKHRHLHCFGYQLSDLKKKGHRISKTPVHSSAPSSPNLKERTPNKNPQTMSPFQRPTDSKVDSILSDLKTLLIMGQPVEHGEEWLSELETHVLEKLEGNARYWVVKALLAERAGRFQDAWLVFSEAVDRDAQPSEELVSALNEFATRVPPARCEETSAIPDAFCEGIPADAEKRKTTPAPLSAKRQSGRSQRGNSAKSSSKNFQDVFESTVIKYTMQNSSTLQNLNKVLNLGTPTVATLLTPVRRSARLLRSESCAGKRRSFNADDLPAPLREMFQNVRNDGV